MCENYIAMDDFLSKKKRHESVFHEVATNNIEKLNVDHSMTATDPIATTSSTTSKNQLLDFAQNDLTNDSIVDVSQQHSSGCVVLSKLIF
ncbi:hypothetical protein V6N12_066500 [Hibiscus sabdariffa]|uniref:Uncharacterized protein n=1 Tax=Hibiscus sabdariffa TaxID=183260 RepID=A0ABR2CSP0_9ROSI